MLVDKKKQISMLLPLAFLFIIAFVVIVLWMIVRRNNGNYQSPARRRNRHKYSKNF
jgi:flagellar biogenesis protein FliO